MKTLPAVEVTEKMIKAGVEAFTFDPSTSFVEDTVREVYISMEAARRASPTCTSQQAPPDEGLDREAPSHTAKCSEW